MEVDLRPWTLAESTSVDVKFTSSKFTSVEVGGIFHGSSSTSMELGGSFHGSTWRLLWKHPQKQIVVEDAAVHRHRNGNERYNKQRTSHTVGSYRFPHLRN